MTSSTSNYAILVFLTLGLLFVGSTRGQQAQPSCAASLVPCADYLNSTSPPPSCCNSLRQVVTTQLPCLCNLYNTPGLLAQLGINVTQALLLPRSCNVPGDITACNALAPGSTASPATPTGGNGGNSDNGVGSISWSAMPALLFIWALTYLY